MSFVASVASALDIFVKVVSISNILFVETASQKMYIAYTLTGVHRISNREGDMATATSAGSSYTGRPLSAKTSPSPF